ncbi:MULTISPECIES: DEAD/DEAH box helicase [Pseudanabaena]|jgi:SNF2 family DNA or RNA helicase|uniref:DEAD/DEAH box helicase n=1 Tax=Pseudanabaena TaxID=1152 RepID=UPI00247957D1|nr:MULTISPECIES: DEAD/DEAH box helicase [Pseudanabaena]MEA5490176.1 DEAD/DEAH box helicase [Pseudanabaena sp. CCNP1317]WGS75129.1 DEAD/DEAH box helicase [Pseudanabaena galeata CCNP1313]
MKILHGTWIPDHSDDFIQTGNFYIWVETTESKTLTPTKRKSSSKLSSKSAKTEKVSDDLSPKHPASLAELELKSFLSNELAIKDELLQENNSQKYSANKAVFPKYFLLPTSENKPLPSLESARYLEIESPENFDLQYWQIDCYQVTTSIKTGSYQFRRAMNVVKLLNDLHFIAINNLAEVQLGSDLLFWYHYTQAFKQIILKDQYIPAIKYRELEVKAPKATKTPAKTSAKSKKAASQAPKFEIYPAWEIVSEQYAEELQQYVEYMPLACVAGFSEVAGHPLFSDHLTLLQHFSESVLHSILTNTSSTAQFEKLVSGSLLQKCLDFSDNHYTDAIVSGDFALEEYQQWQAWKQKIVRTQSDSAFYLCFQLQAPLKEEEPWQLQFQVSPKQDPSLKLPLADYWTMTAAKKKTFEKQFGKEFEQNLLLNLGYAARIYNPVWQGLETDRPIGLSLDLDQAFEFLKESAWVLEDAGYKVVVPAWWTPAGRRRAKIKLKGSSKSAASSKTQAKSYFGFDQLVEYQYELAIGDESISAKEWEQLVNAKAPLVKFRGEWIELDRDKMQEMLTFWQQQGQGTSEMSLIDLMKLTATDPDWEVDRNSTLSEMLSKLQDKQQFEPIENPLQLNGTLREYQKRGVAWLQYLENLGLNGCLADDMGLGKTVQIIARLVNERAEIIEVPEPTKAKKSTKTTKSKKILPVFESVNEIPPTLLIAPTSVVGNWQKEIEKFAPHLRAIVHHGSDRLQDAAAFQEIYQTHDLIITSFTLIRKDEALFSSVNWHRIVIDEAQNIKNPKAAQTKAILKLESKHRLALTGTPVENRLLDLWSIFNFLNPNYLGKEAQFKKSFETPIQKNNDQVQAGVLKKLVEPFILRRVKTDQSIIKDLPDKIEQKLYTNLTKEQASLYEVVVRDVEKQLNEVEGIQRKGLILSTLLKLKQICNHPRQFLQDGSDFTTERSHKLSRLSEMMEEVISEGESLLIFTQFTEIGDALEKYIRQKLNYNSYYIHGGTNRDKRERMITEFQDPETEPSVFILSLKAGGVGITLTKANHVFHFDRWWNPAVEDQATDRAFRIGQKKNVFVHKFITIGSLEERIDQMIEDKKKLAGAIVGADESWLTELDNDKFKQLIALNKSAIID